MWSTREEFADLVRRANGGDKGAIEELRWTLDANPDVWRQVGDLSVHAESALLTLVAGSDLLARESITRQLQAMRSELGGSSPLERLAVDRVVISWLQLQYAEIQFGGSSQAAPKHASQIVRWLDQAGRRYNAAVRSLLDIRRLMPAASQGGGPRGTGEQPWTGLRVVGGAEAAKPRATGT